MAVASVPIVGWKLHVPRRVQGTVRRVDLLRRLQHAAETLWLIAAPAGYGKTTLLLDAVEEESLPTAWLTVDERDSDPIRLWSHLLASLATVGVDVTHSATLLADGEVDTAADALTVALEPVSPMRLVFDDVHLLDEDSSSLELILRLIESAPPQIRTALSTRSDLGVALSRQIAAGDATRVTATDLALSAEDAAAMLPGYPYRTVRALVDRLDGWPAGIRLASLASASSSLDGDTLLATMPSTSTELRNYLSAEVFGALPADVQRFVLDVSVLDDLTPAACDAVTTTPGALGFLRRLATDQVFTTDVGAGTHRFHALFREFLLDRLHERHPERIVELHRRAAHFFIDTDDPDRVVHHASAAGDHELALDTIGEHYIALSNAGRIDTFWRWISEVGPERVLGRAEIAAMPAWVSLNRHRYDEIDPWLDSITLVDDLDDGHITEFALQSAEIRSYRARHLGDLDAAADHAARAVEISSHLPDDSVSIPTAYAVHGTALALAGDERADAVLRRALELGRARNEHSAIVFALSMLSIVADDADAASRLAHEALQIVADGAGERFHQPSWAHLGIARAALATGRIAEAHEHARNAMAIADEAWDPAAMVLAELVLARVAHHHGDLDGARSELRRAEQRLADMTGTEWLEGELRETTAVVRFAPLDAGLPPGTIPLSDREMAVLRLLPHPLSRREIAEQLFVSENTVKSHLTSIRHKLGTGNRDELIERARSLGLLSG